MDSKNITNSDALITSWSVNAEQWTDAIRAGAIASRRLVTNGAVIDAVLSRRPSSVLDLGCGEGWLTRALGARVERIVGVDVSAELIERAASAGGGTFHRLSYDDVAADPARLGTDFDVVVANFALLDAELAPLLRALVAIVAEGGALVVQTLHPGSVPPPYEDGWREEDFSGFGDEDRWRPMPWYFRTLGSWHDAISKHWRVTRVAEPLHPQTRLPASLLITATVDGR